MSSFTDTQLSRRRFIEAAGVATGMLLAPGLARTAEPSPLDAVARAALAESRLVYLSPLRSDGSESRCHAEVWFVADGDDVLVCTPDDRWRARAIARGLDRARLWVADFGPWSKAGDRYRTAPSFVARGERHLATGVAPAASRSLADRALESFGRKYADEWGKWGPRFRSGLEDGSRVLLRYRPIAS